VVTIPRHEIDTAWAQQIAVEFADGMARYFGRLEKNPKTVGRLFKSALTQACCRTADDPTANSVDTWNVVALAMQASSAMFAAANQPEGTEFVEARIRDEVYRIPAQRTYDVNPFDWLRAMWLGMICRERPRIDELATVSVEVLTHESVPYDQFMFDWVRALQVYWRQEDGLIDMLLRAMQGTDPAALQHIDEEFVLHLHYPPMELFYLLTQREDAKFNESLAKALELHKRYWSATEERRKEEYGFVAWGPLAIACLALDAGVTIEVESEYLPANLLNGTWVGERTV
jgi:hypothetical protein